MLKKNVQHIKTVFQETFDPTYTGLDSSVTTICCTSTSLTTQAIHHGQISTAPIVRTTSIPSTITQAVPQSTNAILLVTATSASHGCLPVYNASLQGSSDSQLTAYNASLQVQPTSYDSHTVNPGTGLPIMSTFTQPQYTSRVTDGIGDNVSTNIRNKILLGEYIDLAVLLNNSNSNNTHDNQKNSFH